MCDEQGSEGNERKRQMAEAGLIEAPAEEFVARGEPVMMTPDGKVKAIPDARRVLVHLTIEDLNALTKKELRELASAAGMPTGGRKPAILKRLIAVKAGGNQGHVGGRTLCPACKHIVMIVHTEVGQYRRGRCTNPKCGWRGKLPWGGTRYSVAGRR